MASTRPLVAVSLMGVTGNAQFSGNGSVLTYSGGLTGSLNLVADAQGVPPLNKACLDSGATGSSMRTAMASTGTLGVSHATASGSDLPVLLLDSAALAANNNLSVLQGSYTVLRYQHDTSSLPAQTRASYVSFTIDAAGNWGMCKNTPTCATPTATGTLSATAGSSTSFDLSAGGLVRAKAYLVGTGANRTLVMAEKDTGGGGVVSGLWLGVPKAAWNPVVGSYVLNSTDGQQNVIAASQQNLVVGNQNRALTADTPLQGIATTTVADGTVNYLIASPSGLLVTANNTGNNFANGPAYFSFGVTP